MSEPLLVVGSVALDTLETRAGKRVDELGGAATYISLAASHFCSVNLVGVVGADDFDQAHTDLLQSHGVDLTGLERAEGRTFRWSGVYADDFASRQTLDTQLGVFAAFDPKIPDPYLACKYLMLGNIHPALQLKVLDRIGGDVFVGADTMNLWIDTTRDELDALIRRVDLLIINDEEATMLTGEPQIRIAADKIRAQGPRVLVIKRGEHGAYLFVEDTIFFAPALPLPEVIDPTGAGDTFAGGLMGYLAGQDSTGVTSVKKGMVYGAALASATVEGFGPYRLVKLDRVGVDSRFSQLQQLVAIE